MSWRITIEVEGADVMGYSGALEYARMLGALVENKTLAGEDGRRNGTYLKRVVRTEVQHQNDEGSRS